LAGSSAAALIVGTGRAAASTGTLRRPDCASVGEKMLLEKPGMSLMVSRSKSSQERRLRMSHQQWLWMPVPMERRATGRTAGLEPVRYLVMVVVGP